MTTANLSLQDNEAVDSYTSVGESEFQTTFPVLVASELKVSKNQAALTYGVDWSILSGLGAAGGVTVEITAGTTSGDRIVLWLDLPIERLSGYSAGAATLMPEDLNADAVQGLRINQTLRRDLRRSVRLAPDDPVDGQDMTLPAKAERLGKIMGFDSETGAPEMVTVADIDGSTVPLTSSLIGTTLDSLKRTPAEIAAGVVPTSYAYAPGDLRRYGVVADDTDQTSEIVAALTALGSTYDGPLTIPPRARFDFTAVLAAVPYRAVLHFTNVHQTGTGYRQQLVGVMTRPEDADTDTAFAIIDPHYPDLMLNNPRTGGTDSATKGLSGFSWFRGFFANGTKGPRPQWQLNFTKSAVRTAEYGGEGVACYTLITRAPERAGDWEYWFDGIEVEIGDYISAENGYFYSALSAGTSTVSPTHDTGTATVGGVEWQFESAWIPFKTVFYVDELGRIGTERCGSGFSQEWEQNPEDVENYNVRYSARGASKKVTFTYRVTDSNGDYVAMPGWDYSESDGMRLLSESGALVLFQADETVGFQTRTFTRGANTAADADTTPSVTNCGRLVLANTGATSVTTFDNPIAGQEVELFATTANTTLVHSSALLLKGATNAAMPANGIVVITRNPANNAWVEKSRSF